MLRIGVCDDDEKDRERIESLIRDIIKKWDGKYCITLFESGEELCKALQSQDYQVLLLDIQMPNMNGIETLKKIEEMRKESLIIFVSSDDTYLRKLYAPNVLGFLDKPVEQNLLKEKLIRAKELLVKEASNVLVYNKKGISIYVKYSDIIYVETKMHYLYIQTPDEVHRFKGTMNQLWERLQQSGTFCRPHRSYIINMKYLESSTSKDVVVNGIHIVIGRYYKADTQKRLLHYVQQLGGKYAGR